MGTQKQRQMIIRSTAPLRLGLAGGGTDVSPYCDMFGGAVLNATINLSAYCTIEPLEEAVMAVDAADAGLTESVPLGKPSGALLIDGVANRIQRDFGPLPSGFSIKTWNDAPAGSGLGTSSTMVVTILKCFLEWLDIHLGKYELARLAYEIERQDLGLSGGRQDQYAATFGGFNFMEFLPEDKVTVSGLDIKPEVIHELEASTLLYFTGRSRESAAIIDEQKKATSSGKADAIEAMHRIRKSAFQMRDVLLEGRLDAYAAILGRAWEDKKKMARSINNSFIQEAFDTAMAAGAVSGKISGAGGGGFMMLFVPTERKNAVANALGALPGKVVPFYFTEKGVESWK